METEIHKEKFRHHTIKIGYDEFDHSPREWDTLGTMVCFHNRYNLGDENPWSIEEAKEIFDSKDYISLPLYLYDHSGITMNTTGFSCPWDSGQVGFIWVAKEDVLNEYNRKRMSNKLEYHVRKVLESEVEIYDQYLRGDIYYFSIEKDGDIVDSCGGIYGFNYCLEEAKSAIRYMTKEQEGLIYSKEDSGDNE